MARHKIIYGFVFLCLSLHISTFGQDGIDKSMINALIENAEEGGMKAYFEAFEKVRQKVEDGLDKRKFDYPQRRTISADSTRRIIEKYTSFNKAYLNEFGKTKVGSNEARAKYVEEKCRKNGIHEYFAILDEFFVQRMKSIRKTLEEQSP